MMKKNDEHDAYCVATVLINQLHTLPDAKLADNHWTISQLVNHRDNLVKDGVRLENNLHQRVSAAYPSYAEFFCNVDSRQALHFWKTYPSPMYLKGKSAEELKAELREVVKHVTKGKAEMILEFVYTDGNTLRDFQESRDFSPKALSGTWGIRKKNWLKSILRLKKCLKPLTTS